MIDRPARQAPLRLFLDSGVIVDGCRGRWGGAKAVLILTASAPQRYTILLAEPVELEVRRSVARIPDTTGRAQVGVAFEERLNRVKLERLPTPELAEIGRRARFILPALRHSNDLPAVVAAVLAAPDWVLSTNTRHWTPELGGRLGLRVAHPTEFLRSLVPER